jgi:hypothetical protein
MDYGAAIVAMLVYRLLRDRTVPPVARNFSFLHLGKIIFAAELPSLRYTILGLCGDADVRVVVFGAGVRRVSYQLNRAL